MHVSLLLSAGPTSLSLKLTEKTWEHEKGFTKILFLRKTQNKFDILH